MLVKNKMIDFLITHPELLICTLSLLIFIITFIFYSIKISKLKKTLAAENILPAKKTASYTGSLILCFIAEILPFLIPLSLFVLTIICACGILGQIIVFKERIATIRG
ncbi:hypothetical protein [Treponema sp.]|uniref:hypothetical protein n=1 Tax=Treponema sp. TaxID=166 RepID=UPI0026014E26|nr:hypothetical protein [Treponema sp.]MCR5217533.1 hypothetical protein [Treponema sp.]